MLNCFEEMTLENEISVFVSNMFLYKSDKSIRYKAF